PLDDVAQPLALLVVADAAADADVIDGGHEDQVPAGDGDVAGEAGALGADGILGDLDHDLLTDLENVLDARLAGGLDLLLLAVLPTVAIAVAAVALAGFLGVAGRALLAPDLALVAPAAAATSVAASLPRLLATLGLLAVPGLGLHRIAGVGVVRGLALCCRAGFPAVRVIRAAGVIGRASGLVACGLFGAILLWLAGVRGPGVGGCVCLGGRGPGHGSGVGAGFRCHRRGRRGGATVAVADRLLHQQGRRLGVVPRVVGGLGLPGSFEVDDRGTR